MVPAPVIELNEANAALDEAPSQQTIIGERSLPRLGPVQTMNGFRLARNIHELGNARLHTIGQLVGRDARIDFRISHDLGALGIELTDGVERCATALCRDPVRILEVEHRRFLRAKLDALMHRGQKTAPPTGLPTVRIALARQQNDEAREIFVRASEAVGQPRSHAGAANDLMTGVHEDLRRGMVELGRVHRLHHRDVVDDLSEVRQEL